MKAVITYYHYGDDEYLNLMRMAFASAEMFGCETLLVTSDDINVGQDVTLKVAPAGENVLMCGILEAQKAYIDSALFDSNSVFFSPDALVARPLGLVFNKPFDLGVTQGTSMEYPINNGVIYIKPEAKENLSLLWADMIARCKSYSEKLQAWYGDQKAMHEVIHAAGEKPHGLRVKRLLSMPYNAVFSHERPWCAMDDLAFHTAYVMHFKGKRKARMAEFWERVSKRYADSH